MSQNLVFATHAESDYSEHQGLEVCIAKTADDSLFDADDLGLEAVLDTWYEDTESVLAGLKAVTK
jgi:hypothetical protein